MSPIWLTVLKNVPWTDVISNAPKVAEGAKKLWSSISKSTSISGSKPKAENPPPTPDFANNSEQGETAVISQLQFKIAKLEASTTELHNQLLASSELINTLAEQNAELIKRIEAYRVRLFWHEIAIVIITIVAIYGLSKW